MDEQHTCPHCGASTKRWWHRMSPGLLQTLVKFKQAVYEKNMNKIHVPDEVGFTTSEYNNFQKLRYFGLVAKWRDESGNHKGGYWLLTRRGGQFLRGEIQIPERVCTFRNRIVEKAQDYVDARMVLGREPYWDTKDEFLFGLEIDNADFTDIEEAVKSKSIYKYDQSGQAIMF